ncbi:hypothetical protein Peur_060247 [Populus x canadensis]
MGSGRFSFLFVGVIKASASEPSFAFLDSQTLVIPHHRDGLYFKARVCKDIIHYFPVFAPLHTINLTFEGKNFRLEPNVFSLLIE